MKIKNLSKEDLVEMICQSIEKSSIPAEFAEMNILLRSDGENYEVTISVQESSLNNVLDGLADFFKVENFRMKECRRDCNKEGSKTEIPKGEYKLHVGNERPPSPLERKVEELQVKYSNLQIKFDKLSERVNRHGATSGDIKQELKTIRDEMKGRRF